MHRAEDYNLNPLHVVSPIKNIIHSFTMRRNFEDNVISVGNTLFLVIIAVISCSCGEWKMPENLPGNWIGKQSVSIRYTDHENNFHFTNDSLPVVINILQDGTVTGFIGKSKFVNCRVTQNRGRIGKILHIATDFGIEGFLSGKLNIQDKYGLKKIAIPFNIEDSLIKGTIFMTNNSEMLPIVYNLQLKK
jgi:hypothetical protein